MFQLEAAQGLQGLHGLHGLQADAHGLHGLAAAHGFAANCFCSATVYAVNAFRLPELQGNGSWRRYQQTERNHFVRGDFTHTSPLRSHHHFVWIGLGEGIVECPEVLLARVTGQSIAAEAGVLPKTFAFGHETGVVPHLDTARGA